jgi:hypothetical protein
LCGVEKKHVWKILRKYKLFTLTQLVVWYFIHVRQHKKF